MSEPHFLTFFKKRHCTINQNRNKRKQVTVCAWFEKQVQGSTAKNLHGRCVRRLSLPLCNVPKDTRLTPDTAQLTSSHSLQTKTGPQWAKNKGNTLSGHPASTGGFPATPGWTQAGLCATLSVSTAGDTQGQGAHRDVCGGLTGELGF